MNPIRCKLISTMDIDKFEHKVEDFFNEKDKLIIHKEKYSIGNSDGLTRYSLYIRYSFPVIEAEEFELPDIRDWRGWDKKKRVGDKVVNGHDKRIAIVTNTYYDKGNNVYQMVEVRYPDGLVESDYEHQYYLVERDGIRRQK